MGLILSLLLLIPATSWSLPEDQVYNEMVSRLMNGDNCDLVSEELQDFWQLRSAISTTSYAFGRRGRSTKTLDYKLRYSRFGCSLGEHGALVIVPGRTEGSVEYYETAVDYIAAGFSPVYVMDPRGQGLSPRLLDNHSKGHIESFEDFVLDLDVVVKEAQAELPVGTPLFYTSNSMGGAIGINYFQHKGEENPFKAAAILGAMIRINYLAFLQNMPGFIQKKLNKEENVLFLSSTLPKNAYSIGGKDYTPSSRSFVADNEDTMTHSEERYNLRTFLWNDLDWSTVIEDHYTDPNTGVIENWSGPQLGSATNGWTRNSTRTLMSMRTEEKVAQMNEMPLMVMTGTRDNRSYRPLEDGTNDLYYHTEFCDTVNEVKGAGTCTFVPVVGAFHEIYKESDEYRNPSMEKVIEFFLQ